MDSTSTPPQASQGNPPAEGQTILASLIESQPVNSTAPSTHIEDLVQPASSILAIIEATSPPCAKRQKHAVMAVSLHQAMKDLGINHISALFSEIILTPAFFEPWVAYRDGYLLHPRFKGEGLQKGGSEDMEIYFAHIMREVSGRTLRTYRLNQYAGARSHNVRLFSTLLANMTGEGKYWPWEWDWSSQSVRDDGHEASEALYRLVKHLRGEYAHGHGLLIKEIERLEPSVWLKEKDGHIAADEEKARKNREMSVASVGYAESDLSNYEPQAEEEIKGGNLEDDDFENFEEENVPDDYEDDVNDADEEDDLDLDENTTFKCHFVRKVKTDHFSIDSNESDGEDRTQTILRGPAVSKQSKKAIPMLRRGTPLDNFQFKVFNEIANDAAVAHGGGNNAPVPQLEVDSRLEKDPNIKLMMKMFGSIPKSALKTDDPASAPQRAEPVESARTVQQHVQAEFLPKPATSSREAGLYNPSPIAQPEKHQGSPKVALIETGTSQHGDNVRDYPSLGPSDKEEDDLVGRAVSTGPPEVNFEVQEFIRSAGEDGLYQTMFSSGHPQAKKEEHAARPSTSPPKSAAGSEILSAIQDVVNTVEHIDHVVSPASRDVGELKLRDPDSLFVHSDTSDTSGHEVGSSSPDPTDTSSVQYMQKTGSIHDDIAVSVVSDRSPLGSRSPPSPPDISNLTPPRQPSVLDIKTLRSSIQTSIHHSPAPKPADPEFWHEGVVSHRKAAEKLPSSGQIYSPFAQDLDFEDNEKVKALHTFTRDPEGELQAPIQSETPDPKIARYLPAVITSATPVAVVRSKSKKPGPQTPKNSYIASLNSALAASRPTPKKTMFRPRHSFSPLPKDDPFVDVQARNGGDDGETMEIDMDTPMADAARSPLNGVNMQDPGIVRRLGSLTVPGEKSAFGAERRNMSLSSSSSSTPTPFVPDTPRLPGISSPESSTLSNGRYPVDQERRANKPAPSTSISVSPARINTQDLRTSVHNLSLPSTPTTSQTSSPAKKPKSTHKENTKNKGRKPGKEDEEQDTAMLLLKMFPPDTSASTSPVEVRRVSDELGKMALPYTPGKGKRARSVTPEE